MMVESAPGGGGMDVNGTGRSARHLDRADLRRILDLLDDCAGLSNLAEFRHAVLEALARHFGYRNTTFFVARGFRDMTSDRDPVATGRAARMVPAYIEEFQRFDPFARPGTWMRPEGLRPISLDEFAKPVHPDGRRYLDRFMFGNGIHAKVVIPLVPGDLDAGGAGGIGWLAEESGTFGPRDLAIASELHRHLTKLFRFHAPEVPGPDPRLVLSPRQRQVAELVAEGKTNQEIAQTLYIGVDTVKKHLTQVLKVTGCTNRTQLAIRYGAARR
jgi:DNA-binding CsgD family transcriptional regulator